MRYYAEREQDVDYRNAARELGCTCPDGLGAQTHRQDCPYLIEYLDHLDQEHQDDA